MLCFERVKLHICIVNLICIIIIIIPLYTYTYIRGGITKSNLAGKLYHVTNVPATYPHIQSYCLKSSLFRFFTHLLPVCGTAVVVYTHPPSPPFKRVSSKLSRKTFRRGIIRYQYRITVDMYMNLQQCQDGVGLLLGRYRDVCGEINDSILKSVLGFHTAREKQPYIIYARDCRSRPPSPPSPLSSVSESSAVFSSPSPVRFPASWCNHPIPTYPPLNDGKRFRKCLQFIAVATVVVVVLMVGRREKTSLHNIIYTAHLPVYDDRIFVKQ